MKKIILLIFLYIGLSAAQNNAVLYDLYQKKDFRQLEEKYEKVKTDLAKAERLFFDSVFLADGEVAFDNYKQLFDQTNGKIKYLAAERLKDYYYAKGYYSTASDYERYLVENRNLNEESVSSFSQETDNQHDSENLYIQVGAFGMEHNAEQMQQMLETQKVESKIVKREVNSRLLYCVWVLGKENFQQTLDFANDLKQKYHLDYKIIKE